MFSIVLNDNRMRLRKIGTAESAWHPRHDADSIKFPDVGLAKTIVGNSGPKCASGRNERPYYWQLLCRSSTRKRGRHCMTPIRTPVKEIRQSDCNGVLLRIKGSGLPALTVQCGSEELDTQVES